MHCVDKAMVVTMESPQKETDRPMAAHELSFARALASNEKKHRDRALKKLQRWLTLRCTREYDFTEAELKTIWVGLHYSMYMSDKPLIQEELAESISKLVHCFAEKESAALLFTQIFLVTLTEMWPGMDQHRVDKYLMFFRRFIRQTLIYCRDKSWQLKLVRKLTKLYLDIVIQSKSAMGIALHFVEIFPEELAKIGGDQLKPSVFVTFVTPFARTMVTTMDVRMRRQCQEFFAYLMKQTDVALDAEDRFRAWRKLGYPGDDIHSFVAANTDDTSDIELEEGEEEEDDDTPQSESAASNDKNVESSDGEDAKKEKEDNDEGVDSDLGMDIETETGPFDPRAGSVHVYLPQLQFPIGALISLLREQKKQSAATLKGRRVAITIIRQLRSLKRGKYPYLMSKVPKEKFGGKKYIEKLARKLARDVTKRKNKSKRAIREKIKKINEKLGCDAQGKKIDNEIEPPPADNQEENQISPNTKKKKLKRKIGEVDDETSPKSKAKNGTDANHTPPTKEKVKKPKTDTKNASPKKSPSPVKILSNAESSDSNKENEFETVAADSSVNKDATPTHALLQDAETTPKKSPPKERKKFVITPVTSTSKKRKISNNWLVEDIGEDTKIKAPKVITLEQKAHCCGHHLEEGEIVIPIKRKAVTPESKGASPKVTPIFWNTALAKVTPKGKAQKSVQIEEIVTPRSDRRISFNLKMNCSQQVQEYFDELARSPQIPFDAEKKPRHSALKAGLPPSPINPFYLRRNKLLF